MIRLFWVLIIYFFSSFLTVPALFADSIKTQKTDGEIMSITEQEAIVIAQNFMKGKGLDKDWNNKKPKIIFVDEKEVGIKFYTKHPFALNLKYVLPYLIVVRRSDGQIVAWGQDKQGCKRRGEGREGDCLDSSF